MKRLALLVPMTLVAFSVQMLAQAGGAAAKPAAQAPKPAAAAAGTARVVNINATQDLKFSVATINAKPGESLKVVLKAVGDAAMPKMAMAHNFVLLKSDANAQKFADAAMMASATAYIPPALKNQVIANTPMAGNGETVEVTFKAPTAPGTYPFLCAFPGHFAAGMKGALIVK